MLEIEMYAENIKKKIVEIGDIEYALLIIALIEEHMKRQ